MSPASHMVGRLRKPHGIVLGRMHSLNERPTHRPLGHGRTTPHCIVEQLEPRLLLSGTLVAALTVDNSFDFYVSTSDLVVGTLAGHGDNWGQTYHYSTELTPGVVNYLHVRAVDVGGVAGFGGIFHLDGAFSFRNGTDLLDTAEASEWSVSRTGFGQSYEAPTLCDFNWGSSLRTGRAIWTNHGHDTDTTRYFSAAIMATGSSDAPPAPLLVDLQPGSDSGVYDTDDLTNIATPVIDITAVVPGDTVFVYREGSLLGLARQVNDVHYQYSFIEGQLREGTNLITARSFDGFMQSPDSPVLNIVLDLTSPRIVGAPPDAPVNLRIGTLDSGTVTFSEPVVVGSAGSGKLWLDDVAIAGPAGSISPTNIADLGANEYEVSFPAQARRGVYKISVGPEVTDLAGNLMDQDQDRQGGEAADDVAIFAFDAFDADTVLTSAVSS